MGAKQGNYRAEVSLEGEPERVKAALPLAALREAASGRR